MSASPLDDLRPPSTTRLAVHVTRDAARHTRGGHPWVYDGSIEWVKGADGARAGDLAVVFDPDRKFAGIGLWDPASPIRVKVLAHSRPRPIDADFWRERIWAAVQRRASLADSSGDPARETTGYRVIHGENDGLAGLVVDRYADVAVVKIYTEAWLPHLPEVVPIVRDVLAARSVMLRWSRRVGAWAEAHSDQLGGVGSGRAVWGPDVVEPVEFRENGLTFDADVVNGQKTGYFLDQRDNRARVGELSSGATVADIFCCSGGFGVHAAAGGARAVLSVDSSPFAVAAAQRNMAKNAARPEVAACRHEVTAGDAFAVMEDLARSHRRFDLVVVDPPSFASNAASVSRAVAAYTRLAELAAPLVSPGGVLVHASCSSRVDEADFARAVHHGAGSAGVDLDEFARTGHPIDHPIGFSEGAYLKAIFARVRPR